MHTGPLAACPLCHASQGEEVQSQCLKLAGLGTVEIGFGYCRVCGHIYQVRPAPPEKLDEHYASYSNYTCFDRETARAAPVRAPTRRLLTLAEARAPRAGRVYEVGCATGYHLEHFRRAGWEVGGCDLSPKASAQALENFGISVDCGPEMDVLPRQSGLAVVLFSHALEHVADPLGALSRARDAIADKGMVLLEVPCAIAPELMPPGWFTFEHLHYFSEACLLRMLKAAGFMPIEVRIAFKAELYPVIAVIAGAASRELRCWEDQLAVSQTRQFLGDFIARDEALWNAASDRIGSITGRAYVWGAGVHTAQLFDRTALLGSADVIGIVDRDSQKWGYFQADREIVSPDDFLARYDDEPVIISSFAAEAQIARNLADCGIAQDRIVRLYG